MYLIIGGIFSAMIWLVTPGRSRRTRLSVIAGVGALFAIAGLLFR
jgi:hypothetical protein